MATCRLVKFQADDPEAYTTCENPLCDGHGGVQRIYDGESFYQVDNGRFLSRYCSVECAEEATGEKFLSAIRG